MSSTKSTWQLVARGISQRPILGLMLFNALLTDGDDWTECPVSQFVGNNSLEEVAGRLEGRAALQMDPPMLEKRADGNPVRFKGKWRVSLEPCSIPGGKLAACKAVLQKGPGVLAGSELSVGQQCALAAKDVNCIPRCIRKTRGSRPREWICFFLVFVRLYLEYSVQF